MIADTISATIGCVYSNIGKEWIADIQDDHTGDTLAVGRGKTRAESLRDLADAMESAD